MKWLSLATTRPFGEPLTIPSVAAMEQPGEDGIEIRVAV